MRIVKSMPTVHSIGWRMFPVNVNLAAFWKEYWHDATPEPRDIVTAVLGGGVVWITVLALIFVEFLKG